MAKVRLAPAARDDLRDIRIYSKAAFGAPVARKYLEGLRGTFGLLRERPLAGPEKEELGSGIRGFVHRSHCIYYRFDGKDVLIVRILHHARDMTRALESKQ